MSVIVWIGLGAIAFILARTMVNHPLVIAAVLIASSSWASPSSAADAPGAWITTAAKVPAISR